MTQEPYMCGGPMNSSSGYFNHQYSSQPDINHSSNYPPPFILPDHELTLNDLDYAQQVMMLMNTQQQQQQQQQQNEASNFSSGSACSSSYLSSPSSLASYSCCSNSGNMHRSESIHSFQKSGFHPPALASASSPTGVPSDSDDLLQQGVQVPRQNYRAGSPLSSPKESSLAIIEGMSKAQKYSPEEKRERIERYKSKRNQRNFNKKIQVHQLMHAGNHWQTAGHVLRVDLQGTMTQTISLRISGAIPQEDMMNMIMRRMLMTLVGIISSTPFHQI